MLHSMSSSVTACMVSVSNMALRLQDAQEALNSCIWEPVPAGWTEHCNASRPFYIHQATGHKQWARPSAAKLQTACVARHHAPALFDAVQPSELPITEPEADSPRAEQLASECGTGLPLALQSPPHSGPNTPSVSPKLTDFSSHRRQHRQQPSAVSPRLHLQLSSSKDLPVIHNMPEVVSLKAIVAVTNVQQSINCRTKRSCATVTSPVAEQRKLSAAEMQMKQEIMYCNNSCWRPETAAPGTWQTALSF